MIGDDLDTATGLPKVKETRIPKLWSALPRDTGKLAIILNQGGESKLWFPKHHVWEDNILTRVKCWKCGVDLKGWRMALDAYGNQVLIRNNKTGELQPGVAFLDYPHRTSTLFGLRLAKLDMTAVFTVSHCTDCEIAAADGEKAWVCCIAGTDDILRQTTARRTSRVNPDTWATYLYRFSGAEPIGPVSKEAADMSEKILSPGEVLSAAALSLYLDTAQRNKMPSGVVVEYNGEDIPRGWKPSGKKGKIEKI